MNAEPTWRPPAPYDVNDNGKLDPRERRALPDSAFAFPAYRELPLVDAEYTSAAITGLNEQREITDAERDLASVNIRTAAAYFGVALPQNVWGAGSARGRESLRP